MADNHPDPRLIIEKGGYSPDRGGPTLPPARRSHYTKDSGYRPTAGGPTTPPQKPATSPPASNTGSKK
jgi:hypothetical protein